MYLPVPRVGSGYKPPARAFDPDFGKELPAGALVAGMVRPGNIPLGNRPMVPAPGGGIATVRSITVGPEDGGLFYVLPTVVGQGVVSNRLAIDNWRKTGQYLGVFRSKQAAEQFSQALHVSQASQYGL